MPQQPPVKVLPDTVPGFWHAQANFDPDTQPVKLLHLAPGVLQSDVAEGGVPLEYVSRGRPGAGRIDWLDSLPAEQGDDDELSLVFDSEPLTEPLTLLGHSRLRLALQIDTPVAGIWVRLNELDPDGASWPVSHFVGSLNRLLDDQAPVPFASGEFNEFEIRLNFCAHQFAAGSRLRLALSDAPWPMTLALPPTRWRSRPDRAELTLPLATADAERPLPFELKPGSDPQPVRPDWQSGPDGSVRVEHVPSRYDYKDREVGTRLSGQTEVVSELLANGTTIYTQTASRSWQRDGWDCRLEVGCQLEAAALQIQITEWLQASHDGEVIFRREHRNQLPRELL